MVDESKPQFGHLYAVSIRRNLKVVPTNIDVIWRSMFVGIREEICLTDANIGLRFPRHQMKKDGKRYSIEPKALCCVMV